MLAGSFTCSLCSGAHKNGTLVCPVARKTIPQGDAQSAAPPLAEAVTKAAPIAVPQGKAEGKKAYEDWIGRVIDDRYVLRSVVGRGGMGTVFHAEHVSLQRSVAIKVLNPAQAAKKVAVQRFQNEARASGAIGHPNICGVYDLGTLPDGLPYLVMEFLTGEALSQRITREKKLSLPIAIGILADILAGLEAAHKKNILHRDIKPENVFLSSKPRALAKVVDFGVSKMSFYGGDGEEEQALTKTGMVMGTPYYMSAEQARGLRDLDARVDVYACGVIFYEMMTGVRPFIAKNHHDLLLQIIKQDARPATELRPDLPLSLHAVMLQAMVRDRNKRYATAAQFRRELLVAAQEEGITPAPHMVIEPPKPKPLPSSSTRERGVRGGDVETTPKADRAPATVRGARVRNAAMEELEEGPTQVYTPKKDDPNPIPFLDVGTKDLVTGDWETATEKAQNPAKPKQGPASARKRS